MAETSYRVVPGKDSSYDVEMEKSGGRRTVIPGFRSEHEANAWIVQAKRLIRDAGPWTPLAPRKPLVKPVNDVPAASPQQVEQKQVQDTRNRAATRRAHSRAARER
jgi:hypothetical protein